MLHDEFYLRLARESYLFSIADTRIAGRRRDSASHHKYPMLGVRSMPSIAA